MHAEDGSKMLGISFTTDQHPLVRVNNRTCTLVYTYAHVHKFTASSSQSSSTHLKLYGCSQRVAIIQNMSEGDWRADIHVWSFCSGLARRVLPLILYLRTAFLLNMCSPVSLSKIREWYKRNSRSN